MRGNRMHYSALNQYDALYESEGSDAALAALACGYEADVLEMLPPLLDFNRAGLEYHNAGTKIIDVCRYYWQTRDAAGVQKLRPKWEREVERLVANRTGENGLFPKERYCGDISTQVHSLNVNAKAWRALRDLSAVLKDMKETGEAERLAAIAAEFRQQVLSAIAKSVNRTTNHTLCTDRVDGSRTGARPDHPGPNRQLLEYHHWLYDCQRDLSTRFRGRNLDT